MLTIRFIINPISGKANHKNISEIATNLLDKSLFQCDFYYTEYSKHATELAKIASDQNIDVIVAVGGDGTMHECALGILGSQTALAVLPCGSGNGFAFHFGMKKQIRDAIIQLNHCEFKVIDSCTANNLPFFNVSGVGFDAHIAKLFSEIKIRGFHKYVKLVLQECAFYPAQKYTLEYDGIKEEHNAVIVSWANATQFGNNAQISPSSIVDDGMIEICVLKDFKRYLVPLLLYQLFTGRIHHSRHMKIIKTKKIKISCKNGISHLDGEVINMGTKITIDTVPKSLKIFVPNVKKEEK